jgi:heme O synthase-like polyprenyltransferase
MKDYLTLLKPRVIWLLILASVAGYVYATRRNPDPGVLAALAVALGGTYQVAVVALLAAAAIYTSAKALRARDERSFWLMFKAYSPILAAFLILLKAAP